MNMFTNAKRTASLSSGLLARKGQARPAMRPQGFVGMTQQGLEDLGWNDMGDAPIDHVSTQLTPDPAAPVPPVLRERERLGEELAGREAEDDAPAMDIHRAPEAQPAPEPAENTASEIERERRPVSVNTAARIRRETRHKRGKTAAFTLRLDEDRHLRLRLAAAVDGRSAQALVTEALDAFLESMPEVDDLVSQVANGRGR